MNRLLESQIATAGIFIGAASAVLVGAVIIMPVSYLPHYNHPITPWDNDSRTATHFAIFTLLDDDNDEDDDTVISNNDLNHTIEVMEKHFSKNDQGNYIIQSIRALHDNNYDESNNQKNSHEGYRKNNEHNNNNTYRNYFDVFPKQMKMMTVQSLDNLTGAFAIGKSKYSNISYILYDIEHWKKTPQNEQSNPVRSVSIGADKVHANGFKYGITPDAQFLIDNYRSIDWTQVDFLGIQFQRYSQNITQFSEYTKEITTFVKSKNSSTEVFVQLSFRLTGASQMIDAINSVRPWVDGYIIAYLPGSGDCPNCNSGALDRVLTQITRVDSNKSGL